MLKSMEIRKDYDYKERLKSIDFIRRKAEEIIREEGIWSDEVEQLMDNEAFVVRLREVISYAHQLMYEPAVNFYKREGKVGESDQLKKLEQAVFNFYALTAPSADPSTISTITSAEKFTGLPNTSRNKESIWTSQQRQFQVSPEKLNKTYIDSLPEGPEKNQLRRIQIDIDRWFGPAGLLLHTAVASWAIQATLERMQHYTRQLPENEQSEWHKYLLEVNAKQARVWLNLHDMGRLVTHDPIQHGVFTHVIAEIAGIPHELFYDYDLPSILQFKEDKPLVEEYQVPEKTEAESEQEYEKKVVESRVHYIDKILRELKKMSEQNPQYENPVAVLFFWLIDAFTKLYNVESGEPIASFQGLINNKQVKKRFGFYANLQPGDHKMMFAARAQYRGVQSKEASAQQDAVTLYYLRQYELAESVFTWIDQKLHIPRKLLWQLILDFTAVSDEFLDQNGDFHYNWIETSKRQWSDTTPETHSKQRKQMILGLLEQGIPLSTFERTEIDALFSPEEQSRLSQQ